MKIDADRALAAARRTLYAHAAAIVALTARMGAFPEAIALILACPGRVVTCGVGKSGHVARKLAATLASTGTPAFFVHATEAAHGDLGAVRQGDVVLIVSNSGETDEIRALLRHLDHVPLIAVTGRANSALARAARVHLDASVGEEGCPIGLAPMASSAAAAALGDALAAAVMDARGFVAADYAKSHPAGALGRAALVEAA